MDVASWIDSRDVVVDKFPTAEANHGTRPRMQLYAVQAREPPIFVPRSASSM